MTPPPRPATPGRRLAAALAALLPFLPAAPARAAEPAEAGPPNIIFLMADDLG